MQTLVDIFYWMEFPQKQALALTFVITLDRVEGTCIEIPLQIRSTRFVRKLPHVLFENIQRCSRPSAWFGDSTSCLVDDIMPG
jgi:hypothetical protein